MKPYISTALAAVLVLALPACQQQKADSDAATTAAAGSIEALSGTWKVDLASLKFEGKPDEYLLKDASYSCATCIPPLTVAADGQMHAVADRPYYDNMSVKAVDDKTIEIHRQKGGKEVSSVTSTVSADGNMLTHKFKDLTTPGQTIEGTQTEKRVGAAPAGAHAISGQWKVDQVPEYSEDARNLTYSVAGNSVTMSSAGQTYTAELDGPAVAIQGDTGGTMVKLTREGANALRETNIRDGKEIGYAIVTPSADGKSITYAYTDTRDGSKVSWTGDKTS
jgi:hypothetical protein